MAVEGPQPVAWSFLSGGTIRQYRFVKISAANTVSECAATTDDPIGVAQDGVTVGQTVKVCIVGISKVDGDADLAAGDAIGTSVDGQAAAYTVSDTTKRIVGRVLIDNAAAGGLITAAIDCAGAARVLA